MHIGILGGSFNPAHEGHHFISSIILKKLSLNQIWWIVTPSNPNKKQSNPLPLTERQKIASDISKHHKIKVKCLEKAHHINYSYLLIKNLIKKHPKYKFYWLIGEDNLATFHHWNRWNKIAKQINIIVFPRNNNLLRSTHSKFPIRYKQFFTANSSLIKYKPAPYWTIIRHKEKDISSSQIRAKKS